MNPIDRNKLLKMLGIIALIFLVVGTATHFHKKNSVTLYDYAKLHPEQTLGQTADDKAGKDEAPADHTDLSAKDPGAAGSDKADAESDAAGSDKADAESDAAKTEQDRTPLTGALLNGGADGQAMLAERVVYPASMEKAPGAGGNPSAEAPEEATADFYYEPLSKNLRRYITGISYPAGESGIPDADTPAVSYDDLRYVHILHYNFDGVTTEGELICNAAIAQALLEIFYELYRNEYQIGKVALIEEYDGDCAASAEDNNTFCFSFRTSDSDTPSRHAQGLAVDINPSYNPCITYREDGSQDIIPDTARNYADRDVNFPYKIDENDLCCKLFLKYGFTWGGNRNSMKDYGHFQMAAE